MEHLSTGLQAASLGGVGLLLISPDGAHLALAGVVFAGLCSIITTAMTRRGDREKEDRRYAHEKEEREFQAAQIREAFLLTNRKRDDSEARIVAKVEESTQASADALDTANHTNQKIARVTKALGDAVKAKK